jgi:hypothetical protein
MDAAPALFRRPPAPEGESLFGKSLRYLNYSMRTGFGSGWLQRRFISVLLMDHRPKKKMIFNAHWTMTSLFLVMLASLGVRLVALPQVSLLLALLACFFLWFGDPP